MKRINVMITGFYDNSLLGVSREIIKDTFSEVTTTLEAISFDLGQERVALFTPDESAQRGGESGQEGAEPGQKSNVVSQVEVMPFSTIKRQIDDNYNDIQTKTTQAVIKRLGLGTGVIFTEHRGMQTVDEYVHKDVYNALDSRCFDAE